MPLLLENNHHLSKKTDLLKLNRAYWQQMLGMLKEAQLCHPFQCDYFTHWKERKLIWLQSANKYNVGHVGHCFHLHLKFMLDKFSGFLKNIFEVSAVKSQGLEGSIRTPHHYLDITITSQVNMQWMHYLHLCMHTSKFKMMVMNNQFFVLTTRFRGMLLELEFVLIHDHGRAHGHAIVVLQSPIIDSQMIVFCIIICTTTVRWLVPLYSACMICMHCTAYVCVQSTCYRLP